MDDLKTICEVIAENKPVSVLVPHAEERETLWCDASTSGGGYILETRGISEAFQWGESERRLPIHILEAKALKKGLRRWVKCRESDEAVDVKTDSMLVFHAVNGKKARGFQFNQEMLEISDLLREKPYSVEWVPTQEQKADELSRVFNGKLLRES